MLIITDDNAPAPSCSGCLSVASQDVPAAIPDAVTRVVSSTVVTLPGVMTSTIIVSAPPEERVVFLTVRIGELLHTYTADLRLRLVAPNGQSIPLVAEPGVYQDQWGPGHVGFVGTIFDDRAPTPLLGALPPNFTGRFQPDGHYWGPIGLGGLGGQVVSGAWQLVITDVSLLDTGTLYAWSIEFQKGYNTVYLPLVVR